MQPRSLRESALIHLMTTLVVVLAAALLATGPLGEPTVAGRQAQAPSSPSPSSSPSPESAPTAVAPAMMALPDPGSRIITSLEPQAEPAPRSREDDPSASARGEREWEPRAAEPAPVPLVTERQLEPPGSEGSNFSAKSFGTVEPVPEERPDRRPDTPPTRVPAATVGTAPTTAAPATTARAAIPTATSAPSTATTDPTPRTSPTATATRQPTGIPSATPVPPTVARPRVGIQVGHWKNSELPGELAGLRGSTGAAGNGWREVDINLDIARRVSPLLEKAGVLVDLIPATVPPRYQADAFVALHGDANSNTRVSGYKLARARWSKIPERDDALLNAISEEYRSATGLPEHRATITTAMVAYYAFENRSLQHAVAPTTPAVILEMGFLTTESDRRLVMEQPDRVAQGIAKGILRFLGK